MASFREMLFDAKSAIKEVDTSAVSDMLHDRQVVILDVRETDEFEQGSLQQVVHIPHWPSGSAS